LASPPLGSNPDETPRRYQNRGSNTSTHMAAHMAAARVAGLGTTFLRPSEGTQEREVDRHLHKYQLKRPPLLYGRSSIFVHLME